MNMEKTALSTIGRVGTTKLIKAVNLLAKAAGMVRLVGSLKAREIVHLAETGRILVVALMVMVAIVIIEPAEAKLVAIGAGDAIE